MWFIWEAIPENRGRGVEKWEREGKGVNESPLSSSVSV
jgi:hypothetical protein